MIIFPAIDLKDGTCVRLFKGDYATAHKVAEDPLQTAKSFEAGRCRVDSYGRLRRCQSQKAGQCGNHF